MAVPAESPWNLGGLSVRELAERVWAELSDDEVTERAAALSYYFLFALFPALLFLIALLGFLPLGGLQERLMAYMRDVLPPDAASTLERTLTEVLHARRSGLLSLGALVALWASSNGMVSVMQTMNMVFDVEERRPWWKQRLLAILLTVAFSMFIVAALTLIVFGPKIGEVAASWFGLGEAFMAAWNLISVPLVIACALIGIELVYYLAPASDQRWQGVTPGAALALVLWLAMSFGLRFYVARFANYSATYGGIGGVILLMLWLYLSALVLLVGAEIDSEIQAAVRRRAAPERRRAERVAA
jgi:membrane protein